MHWGEIGAVPKHKLANRQYNNLYIYTYNNTSFLVVRPSLKGGMAGSRFSRRSRTEVKASQGDRMGRKWKWRVNLASRAAVEYASVALVTYTGRRFTTHPLP